MEVTGLVASCVGISGIALKAVNRLDGLIQRFETSSASLNALKAQVRGFYYAVENIRRVLQDADSSNSLVMATGEAQLQIQDAVEAGRAIIRELELEISEVLEEDAARGKDKDLSKIAKARLLWHDDQVQRWSDLLHRQTSALMLILHTQQLLRGGFFEPSPMSERTARPLATENIAADLEAIGLDMEQHTVPRQLIEFGEHLGKSLSEDVSSSQSSDTKVLSSSASVSSINDDSKMKKTTSRRSWRLGKESKRKKAASDGKQQKQAQRPPPRQLFDIAEESVKHYRSLLSAEAESLVPECPRLRVVLIGKTGVGKSTLCSKILGIPYEGSDELHGQRTSADRIKDPLTYPGVNDHLELRDSGGFEAGADDTIKETVEYISSNQLGDLASQIHCIWYVISCASERPIQAIDEKFLTGQLVNTGEIPIFAIFTKYDVFVEQIQRKYKLLDMQSAEEKAYECFKTNLEGRLKSIVGDNPRFSICRVALVDMEEWMPKYTTTDAMGSQALVQKMTQQLRSRDLQILWVATQQRDNWAKLIDGISNSISLFWTARRITKVSYLPYICLVGLNVVWEILHSKATKCWGIASWNSLDSHKTLDSIFQGTGTPKIWAKAYLLACNCFGSTFLSEISSMVIRMVIGVHLIGYYMRELQDRKGSDLTSNEVEAAMRDFEESVARDKMSHRISEELAPIPFKERDCTGDVTRAAIRVAKEAAVGSLESLFEEMRRKE
ncbi:hypothetical protein NCS55_00375400 [Fusarium keratoplasticum]|nr:hypothetical protein NCS55_00375400 [Fusarium keratoplasticum]